MGVTLPGTCSWRLASTSGFSKRAPNLSITPIPLENVMRMDSPLSRRNFLAGTIGAAAVSNGIPITATFGDVEQSVSQTKSGTIQTVLGPLDAAKLGFCQSHEHVCSVSAGIWNAWPEILGGRAQFVKAAVDKLRKAKDEGLDSFIDLTTIDLGRDIRLIQEVSR